ncbi:glutamate racemase [Gorillibacterium sp. sgz5001074]|uniref:glutamate racemase n=1 Tax=Gorillibacterium sp. sgz5001074 TaxID=3446695 RepID=UPI003F66A88C
MRIGVMDSGVGGVTVLAEALRRLPGEDYVYFADTRNVPYGEKPKDEVRRFIFEGVERMLELDMKALVIACNTATSIAAAELRKTYDFPIIGMEPAVKPAVLKNETHEKRVLVCATSLTLKETKYKELVSAVDRKHIVDSLALPGLVELAERGMFEGSEAEAYLRQELSKLELANYGTAVLGCTHFPLFSQVFRKVLSPGTDIIDGAEGTVKHLASVLDREGLSGGGSGRVLFESSGCRETDLLVFQAALEQARSLIL